MFNSVMNACASLTKHATRRPNSLESMTIDQKHQLASIIKTGWSYNAAMQIIFNNSSPQSREEFFNDPVVQRKILKGLMYGIIRAPHIITAMKDAIPNIDANTQIDIMNHMHIELLLSSRNTSDDIASIFAILGKFLTEQSCVADLSRARTMLNINSNAQETAQPAAQVIAVTEQPTVVPVPAPGGQFGANPNIPRVVAENFPEFITPKNQGKSADPIIGG